MHSDLAYSFSRDRVSRLRVRSSAERASRLKTDFTNTASAGSLHPPELSRAAILCIQSLRTHIGQNQNVWSHIGREVKMELAAAWRPSRQSVPPNATTILFADHAELLACLAADCVHGGLKSRWWWRALFASNNLEAIARREWMANPHLVPTALAYLGEIDPTFSFLQILSPSEAASLTRETLTTFHAGTPESLFNLGVTTPLLSSAALKSLPAHVAWQLPAAVVAVVAPEFPLPEPQKRLVVIAALLQQSLSWVRSSEFVVAINCWAKSCSAATVTVHAPVISYDHSVSGSEVTKHSHQPGSFFAPEDNPPEITKREFESSLDRALSSPYQETRYDNALASDLFPAASISLESPSKQSPSVTSLSTFGGLPSTSNFGDRSIRGDRVQTQYGGIFYLVNVALALDFYGDFTAPAHRSLALSLWDFLAIFGERFIGSSFIDDPLYAMLARLSGRIEDERPGQLFKPPDNKPLNEWVIEIEQQMRHRIEGALGVHEADALRSLLFFHQANVCATVTQVDVTYPLSEHPIELRLAGLDRNPGWIPAGGRILTFHYE